MTKDFFFIYSLPRSGSAWLSVFLTGGNSYCYHDPLADGGLLDLVTSMRLRPEYVVGAIDTSAYQFELPLRASIPGIREYILIRSPKEISASAARLGFSYNASIEQEKMLREHPLATPIYFSRFHEIVYLADVWAEVIGTKFDAERAALLAEMKIERQLDAIITRVQRRL